MPDWLFYGLLLAVGVAILAAGGEFLIRGAARLARTWGISALVIGLTVVAFGTSAPEAAVTVFAAAQGVTDLAVGNVVGSNIANILLILGSAALIAPLAVSRNLLRIDGPLMIASSVVFVLVAMLAREINRGVGAGFVITLIAYTVFTYYLGRRKPDLVPEHEHPAPLVGLGRFPVYNMLLVILGIAGLVGGARLIVDGATGLARLLEVSEHVIGLTIVAIGTSLPELATVVVAARHKQPDIAIGNVVGSNIFNVLFVTGIASLAKPLPVPEQIVWFDGPIMLVICVLFYPLAATSKTINRIEGAILVLLYAGYLGWNVVRHA